MDVCAARTAEEFGDKMLQCMVGWSFPTVESCMYVQDTLPHSAHSICVYQYAYGSGRQPSTQKQTEMVDLMVGVILHLARNKHI